MHKDRGGCASCITQMLLQAVMKASYKTGTSKDDDCVLLVSPSQISERYCIDPIIACFFISTYQETLPELRLFHIEFREHFCFSIPVLFVLFIWLLLFADFPADVMCTTLTL